MAKESYCSPFVNFIGNGADPHDCWQEDGFWPDRVEAELEHLYVWGCEIGLSYLNNGGIIAYLEFISGRTLPEMLEGFRILGCAGCASVCQAVLDRFGDPFPRNDNERKTIVRADEDNFQPFEDKLSEAMERDNYESNAEQYYKMVCHAHGIEPQVYPDLN